MQEDDFKPWKRKTILVSIYYTGKDPQICLDDWDSPDFLFLNDAIEKSLKKFNKESDVRDVCIDTVKSWIFSFDHWWSRYVFKLLRGKDYDL